MEMPQANPTYYERQCQELMRRRRSRTGLCGQVRTMLLRRGRIAEALLLTGLTAEQAAERLGHSSVSAFATAFRGWKGQSPGTFARTSRGNVSTGA